MTTDDMHGGNKKVHKQGTEARQREKTTEAYKLQKHDSTSQIRR